MMDGQKDRLTLEPEYSSPSIEKVLLVPQLT